MAETILSSVLVKQSQNHGTVLFNEIILQNLHQRMYQITKFLTSLFHSRHPKLLVFWWEKTENHTAFCTFIVSRWCIEGYIFLFVAHWGKWWGILGTVLVRECYLCTGCIHADSSSRNTGIERRISIKLSHSLLQSSGEISGCCRKRMSISERATNRSRKWNLKKLFILNPLVT